MNYIHKAIAKKVIENVLNHDLELIKQGNKLEIIDIERRFENIDFFLLMEMIKFLSLDSLTGIDKLNGNSENY